jgi:PKD repeat protein
MAGLWETDSIEISPLADAQYPQFGTNVWQYTYVHNNISGDGDFHVDMAIDSSGTGTNGNNTQNSPIVAEVVNATSSQLTVMKAKRGGQYKARGIFRFFAEHVSERHFEVHPMTELLAWNGSSFVLSNDYRPNIKFVAEGASKTTTQLQNVFSDTGSATVMADNDHIIFGYPAPSSNYVQYDGVALSTQLTDFVSSYFLFRPNLVPSATVRCRIITNTPAATAAAALAVNQLITVNALTRTDMLAVSNQIAALTANQSVAFAKPIEFITLSISGTGTAVVLPAISNVQATNITLKTATIQWATDVSSDSTVLYGPSPSAITNVTSVGTSVTNHSVALAGLHSGTTYYFNVASTGASGSSTDDNQEAHYTFSTVPQVGGIGSALASEGCTPTNGVIDPGEVVTVNFSLHNNDNVDTTNLVATLLAADGVTVPSGPQTYGVVPATGTVTRAFSFTASGTCGESITPTLQLQDGPADFGTATYSLDLGQILAPLAENFDGVTAPALPVGWSTSASGAQSNWVTSTVLADSPPHAAFSPDPSSIGVNELDSPPISITSTTAVLTFRQSYNLVVSPTNSGLGYDGGVLELKTGTGSYTDIVAAGGSFVSGGYNTTVTSTNGNPLAGRLAWSGNSSGFITTVVNLPAAVSGQNVQLRWLCGAGDPPEAPLASSGTLAYWSFDGSGTVTNASLTAPAISALPVTVSNVSGSLTNFAGNPSTGQAIAASGFTQLAGPPATNYSYFAFALTVTNAYQVSLTSFSFDDRASGTGPTNFTVQVSQQPNFLSVIYDSGIKTGHTAFATTPMNTFALTNSGLTGTIYFRIYAYKASNSLGTWRLDNFNVQGDVTLASAGGGGGWYVDSISIRDSACCLSPTNNPPVASFTASPSNGTELLAVTFTDTSTGSITNRFWDFGDSGTTNVTTNSVVHTYAGGHYGVMLVVTGPGGVSTNTQSNYIGVLTVFQNWQSLYFGSTNNPTGNAAADPDGDGFSNLQEFLAGTDPTNRLSSLRILSIRPQSKDLFITWLTGVGKTNALQATPNAVGSYSNNYTDLFVVTNTVSPTNYLDAGALTNGPTRYYRIRLVP